MRLDYPLYLEDIKAIFQNSDLHNQTFFITGSSGLIMSFLIDGLMYLNLFAGRQIHIYATFSNPQSLQKSCSQYLGHHCFHPLIQDITQPINLDIRADYIIHAASNTHPQLYNAQPVETIMLNLAGTKNVLDFARACPDARCLFLSSFEVYGQPQQNTHLAETDIGLLDFTQVRSCYPESKRLGENLCQAYRSEYKLNTLIARLGYIYGPTVNLNSSKADVQFLNCALNHQDIILHSSGEQPRSYCYVADAVSGLLTILQRGAVGEIYNLTNTTETVSLKQFAAKLANLSGVNLKFSFPANGAGSANYASSSLMSTDKIQALGWKPLFNFDIGISHTYYLKKEPTKC